MCAALAQLVEQGTENPCVLGSIPIRGTIFYSERIKNGLLSRKYGFAIPSICLFCQSYGYNVFLSKMILNHFEYANGVLETRHHFYSPSRGMSNEVAKGEARLGVNVEFSTGVRTVPFIARAYCFNCKRTGSCLGSTVKPCPLGKR